jgi:hypothetical protein
VASFVRDNIEPRAKDPYAINEVACVMQLRGGDHYVVATAVVTVTGKEPWLFGDGDFRMWVGAKRTDKDPPLRRPIKGRSANRVAIGNLAMTTAGLTDQVLVDPGRSVVLKIVAKVPQDVVVFMHTGDRKCTIADDANDHPIGRLGPLRL